MIATDIAFFFWVNYLYLNALDILLFDFFLLVIDVPRINLERSKEKERICKDQIKKRKKKQKDYLPNYFLSIPITNKEVLFFQNLFLLLSFILNYI